MNTVKDPLEALLNNPTVSEILINDYDKIYFESDGQLQRHHETFQSAHHYLLYIERLCETLHRPLNREQPFLEMQMNKSRYTLVFGEISTGGPLLSIRNQIVNSLTLEKLMDNGWCDKAAAAYIEKLIAQKKNIIVCGATSTGKTTVLQSLLNLVEPAERCILIEDTKELSAPNSASINLLSRDYGSGPITPVSLQDLIRRALRLRPDRLIVGEVRGPEAYSLLLALSTGHKGSLSSIHAANAKQSLLRLEMLVQLGAPEWDIRSIRRLLTLSTDAIIAVEKTSEGRKLKEICEVKSLEENGIILERVH